MKTAILSVGTEILFGQIVNTNTVFLSQKLNNMGFDVLYHYTVGDNSARLAEILQMIMKDCDLIITTGGLGPTEDDLTKETACRVFEDTLVEHEESMNALKEYARLRGRVLTKNNFKQAMMPSRSVVFDNDAGTAPGFALSNEGKTIICMPGPPREMKRMWQRRVEPYLMEISEGTIYYRMLRCFGIGESQLETDLLPLIDTQTDPTIATYTKEGECSVRVASKRNTLEEAMAACDQTIEEINKIAGDYIYSYDDEELNQVVGKKLIEKNISISACESCTGGMFASRLTDVSGISKVFDRSLVTYTYDAKMQELGVSEDTLSKFTAESAEVAREMADGLFNVTGSDICISVTGLAGPDGNGIKEPGTMYIGLRYKGKTHVKEVFTGRNDRNKNRNYIVLHMFDMINKTIDE